MEHILEKILKEMNQGHYCNKNPNEGISEVGADEYERYGGQNQNVIKVAPNGPEL